MNEWINETSESRITELFGIGSGDLHRCVEIARWLSRGLSRFAKLQKNEKIIEMTLNLSKRLRYGIRKELIPFVNLKLVTLSPASKSNTQKFEVV